MNFEFRLGLLRLYEARNDNPGARQLPFPDCRCLDAYLNAVPFYEKNGFRFMNAEDNDPHTRLMYYDLMNLV